LPPPVPEAAPGLQRAAQDVVWQARRLAGDAAAGARRVVGRGGGYDEYVRHRRQRAIEREAARAGVGAPLASRRRRRRPHRPLSIVGIGVVVAAVALVALLVFQVRSQPQPLPALGVGIPVPAPMAPTESGRAATFAAYRVPDDYRQLVSVTEPSWVAQAEQDARAANAALDERWRRWRAAVPLPPQPASRPLPEFDRLRPVPADTQRAIDLGLAALEEAEALDPVAADELAALGPVALATAAQRLAALRFERPADVATARRLHQFLHHATGCPDPEFVEGGATWREVARQNRNLGALWTWVVNEIAHTDRTWRVYRELRGR
ncbi:MAG: hypothetical protein KF830_15240, partial [Planctomycetes bacterium]|nr:hypothetical protein [Planctomycetota bacterium]